MCVSGHRQEIGLEKEGTYYSEPQLCFPDPELLTCARTLGLLRTSRVREKSCLCHCGQHKCCEGPQDPM
jgi:hypothetical protein